MTFEEKRTAALDNLASKGIRRQAYAPTLVKGLWRLGLKVPPPHFAGFFGTFAISAGVFGVAWGLVMWFAYWSSHGGEPLMAAGVSVVVGLLLGLVVASYYRYSARKHSIPRWDDFVPSDSGRNPS
jgi:hypothetical protein